MNREDEICAQAIGYCSGDKGSDARVRAAFYNGAVWADKHPYWISLEDEWPERGVVVLVHSQSFGGTAEGVYWKLNIQGLPAFYSYSIGGYLSDITHWMPMPEEGGEQ